MGKQGPCYHCGTNSTPLWRNGPAEKPVLCNACGSRYRIRGTLENYAPKHAHQGQTFAKRSRCFSNSNKSNYKLQDNLNYHSDINDSSTYKSTSSHDSALSSPLTSSFNNVKQEEEYSPPIKGKNQEKICKTGALSKKRTMVVYRHLTPIEQLQRDLFNIMKYDRNFISQQDDHDDDDDLLIYNANTLQVSPNEIGIGSILLKPTH